MTTTTTLIGMAMIIAGGYVIALNLAAAWTLWIRRTRRAPSWIPLIGGALASFGIYIQENEVVSSLWWIPFFIDYGCIPGFMHTAIAWGLFCCGIHNVDDDAEHNGDTNRHDDV